jgi:hypothetical protein
VSDVYERVIGERLPPVIGMLSFQVFNRLGSVDRYQVPVHKLEQQLRSEFEGDHNVVRVEVWTTEDEGEAFTARYERVASPEPTVLQVLPVKIRGTAESLRDLPGHSTAAAAAHLRAALEPVLDALNETYPGLTFELGE